MTKKILYAVPVKIQNTGWATTVKPNDEYDKGIPCIPCYESLCKFEDKTLSFGEQKLFGEKQEIIMRKLK